MPIATTPQARVFYALVPGVALRRELAELALAVARAAHGRAVGVEQLHLTLLFLGNVERMRIHALCDLAAEVRVPPIVFTLTTVGRFRHAGVAWVAPADDDAATVSALAHALAQRAQDAGFTIERREFHPHITLARRCTRPPPIDCTPALPWHIERFVLMESVPEGGGVRYRELGAWVV
jgi:2'-5' RNA ligase